MSDDLRIETLGHDSLAASQENLHTVDKSTVPDSLQNEIQESEMQGHLPECPYRVDHPTLPRNRGLICICAELRACEQRVRQERTENGTEMAEVDTASRI